ncbi:uncharacterized protein LY89DRAFT_36448 [Mollisia scopiformis]|uniref:Uncharacterized protein n=1 Tax=Mollisia scopiformis TaxID=149040 RepID=A0A194XD30_MOLSC|nr:uncharacterized protein LY89DRAFT_36448 [Mollisia scopiformis]KUJ18064.1 hypothetical protein LY89DRAFT_36448 [Mollisia scopiformis]
MPTYHALGFSVRLHVWDAEQQRAVADERIFPSDPSIGCALEEVSEEYFQGRHGVDFLGQSGAPFYLVNAGRDLFFRQPQSLDGCKDVITREVQGDTGSTVAHTDVAPSKSSSLPELPSIDSLIEDSDSPLSSVPTDFDSSPPGPIVEQDNVRADSASRGWLQKPTKPVLTKDSVQKPIKKSIPVKVQCQFSRKSFPRSLDSINVQDFSINIFYNGEFVMSKTYRAETVRAATAAEKQPNYSGRRLPHGKECPFMVLPLLEGKNKSDGPVETNVCSRWNKINETLLVEADQWGRAGKYGVFRSPIGEYLEDLSKLAMPEGMAKKNNGGRNIGIIDVVIALGRTLVLPSSVGLVQPQRKLPSAYCGPARTLFEVPDEPRSGLRKRLIEDLHEKCGTEPSMGDSNITAKTTAVELSSASDQPAGSRRSTRKSSSKQSEAGSSRQSDEGYHIETISKSGTRLQRVVTTQSFTTSMAPPRISDRPRTSGGPTRSRSNSIASVVSTNKAGSSRDVPKKRGRESSPGNGVEPSPKRAKSIVAVEIPPFQGDPSTYATTAEDANGQPPVRSNQRPLRQRTKKMHFDEKSPTPAPSSKARNSKNYQTPASASALADSPSSRTRSQERMTGKPDHVSNGSTSNYKSRVYFGMDGNFDEPFDFAFGLDGSGSRKSRPSSSNKKASSSKQKSAPKTPNSTSSAINTPSALPNRVETPATHSRSNAGDATASQSRQESALHNNEQYLDASSSLTVLPPNEHKSQRSRPRVSKGELKGLLGTDQPTDEINNNLGSSSADSTTIRASRFGNKKENNTSNPTNSKIKDSSTNRLKASYHQARLLVVNGLNETDWKTVQRQRELSTKPKATAKGIQEPEPSPKPSPKPRETPEHKDASKPKSTSKSRDTPHSIYSTPIQDKGKKFVDERSKLHDQLLEASKRGQERVVRRPSIATTPSKSSHQAGTGPRQGVFSVVSRSQSHAGESTDNEMSPTSTSASNDFGMSVRQPRRSSSNVPVATLARSLSSMDLKATLSASQRNVIETPILPPSSIAYRRSLSDTPLKLRRASESANDPNVTLKDAVSTPLNLAPTGGKPKPNLIIQTGKANLVAHSDMSSPLTTRSYVHTKEGRKAPTPKSGTFPDIRKTPTSMTTPTNGEFPLHSFVPPSKLPTQAPKQAPPRQTRRLSEVEMSRPPNSSSVKLTPEETNVTSRSLRARPSGMSSPTPTMGPPPRTMSSTKETAQNPSRFLFQSSTNKNDATTPPILPPPKPYTARMSEAAQSQKSRRSSNDPVQPPVLDTTPTPLPSISRPQPTTASSASASGAPSSIISPPADVVATKWTPVDLCQDSVLAYATKEQVGKWFGLQFDKENECPSRSTRREREGVFKAQSIMMGVRYVFGADFAEQEDKGKGKEHQEVGVDSTQVTKALQPEGKGKEREADVEMLG